METSGHLPETLMETRTTFRLVVIQSIHQENLTKKLLDCQVGQIQLVVYGMALIVKLFVPYLLIKVALKLNGVE